MATVKDITDRASEIMNDLGGARYPVEKMMYWVNDAFDLLLKADSSLFATNLEHTCTAGARQKITEERAITIISVVGIPLSDKSTLDAFSPGWQKGAKSPAEQWMPSATSPVEFLLYPPSPAGQTLPIEIVLAPIDLNAVTDKLPLSDDFVTCIVDYVVGMSEVKDASHVSSGRAAQFIQSFGAKIKLQQGA